MEEILNNPRIAHYITNLRIPWIGIVVSSGKWARPCDYCDEGDYLPLEKYIRLHYHYTDIPKFTPTFMELTGAGLDDPLVADFEAGSERSIFLLPLVVLRNLKKLHLRLNEEFTPLLTPFLPSHSMLSSIHELVMEGDAWSDIFTHNRARNAKNMDFILSYLALPALQTFHGSCMDLTVDDEQIGQLSARPSVKSLALESVTVGSGLFSRFLAMFEALESLNITLSFQEWDRSNFALRYMDASEIFQNLTLVTLPEITIQQRIWFTLLTFKGSRDHWEQSQAFKLDSAVLEPSLRESIEDVFPIEAQTRALLKALPKSLKSLVLRDDFLFHVYRDPSDNESHLDYFLTELLELKREGSFPDLVTTDMVSITVDGREKSLADGELNHYRNAFEETGLRLGQTPTPGEQPTGGS